MALKDLISDSSKLTEEAIEKIVTPYVGYDVNGKTITLRPAFSKLGNKQKVLVYLAALRGWPFVTDNSEIATSGQPADMEKKLGIPGGSLRPTLRDLTDEHLITEKDHRYSLEAASLYDVSGIIDGSVSSKSRKGKTKANSKSKKA
jgi:hypothetical protein